MARDPSPPQLWGSGPPPHHIELGPFVLHAPIGRGGMGEVWQGVHTGQGAPVAVKVMTAEGFKYRRKREAFHNEVRSVARLDHPGIVLVLDHGAIPPNTARASGGRLPEGSPYLVMELATGGTLAEAVVGTWGQLESCCLRILDALAHAHARGVIHRDIKPANVLLSGPSDPTQGLKLTDFGTAHALDQGEREGLREQLSGTVQYMPPEQLAGRWRDYGPWTDLYAFGCVVWRLVTGRLPYAEADIEATVEAHFFHEPPAFVPRFPVPDGLEDWLLRLLEKEPGRRFQRAAGAAWALRELDDPVDDGAATPFEVALAEDIAASTVELSALGDPWQPSIVTLARAPAFEAHSSPGGSSAPLPQVPLSPSWKRPPTPGRAIQLLGAGLSLYGLRSVPLVGREAERDRIWWTLGQLRREGGTRMVLLEGAAGLGKTRLAEWIGERAHELGAAAVHRVTHATVPGPGDGLVAAVARILGTTGLERIETAERVAALLERDEADEPGEIAGLTDLLCPTPEGAFPTPAERRARIRRVFEREAARLPLLLILDDLQWGPETLEFVVHLLDRQRIERSPILLLGTLRPDTLTPGTAAHQGIRNVLRSPRAESLPIGPLSDEDGEELVARLLQLSGPLTKRVATRAAGNPLFAVHLVGDWVQRGVLSVGTQGFELADGEEARVPDDIHAVWMAPVEHILRSGGADDRRALELAAALGRWVGYHEWRTVCHIAGVNPRDDLVFELLDGGLALGSELRWGFAHGLLRESIERSARESGRWTEANLLCARMLRAAGAGTLRIAGHLLEGEVEGAVDLLLNGALADARAGAPAPALAALERRERALTNAGVPSEDPAWGKGRLAIAEVQRRMGRLVESDRLVDATLLDGKRHGWPDTLRARALIARAESLWERGRAGQAAVLCEEAEKLAVESGDGTVAAAAQLTGARCVTATGDLAYAEALARTARAEYEEQGLRLDVAECDFALVQVFRQSGRLSEAGELLKELTAFAEAHGGRHEQARCLNALGELEGLRGNLRKAESCYRAAELIYESTSSAEAQVVEFNLALVELGRRRYRDARDRIRRALAGGETGSGRRFASCHHVALAACAAAERDWRAFDRHLSTGRQLQEHHGSADINLASTARLAGDLAFARRRLHRAREAWALALGQWQLLQRTDESLALEKLLTDHPTGTPKS